MSFSEASAATSAEAAAAAKKLNLEKATNFMKQYRDPHSRELKKLSANQFMDVWSHYDKDGEFEPKQSYDKYTNNINCIKKGSKSSTFKRVPFLNRIISICIGYIMKSEHTNIQIIMKCVSENQ